MNTAVSFSLPFAETCLTCHKGVFKTAILYLQIIHILYHFSSIFMLLNDLFILLNICSICLVLKTR